MTALLVVLCAAVGAPLRFAVGEWLDRDFPRGTLLVNVVASTLLGLFTALSLSESAVALLGTGFCGGLSTYSAFAVQAHRSGPRVGTTYVVLTVALSLGGCALGFAVGQA